MKKLILLSATLFLLSANNTFSQTKAGDVFVDVYYGFPDWFYKYEFRNNYPSNGSNKFNIKSTGFIGGRIEYLIARRIGFGLDLWYVKTALSGTRTENLYLGQYYYNDGYAPGTTIQNKYDVNESLARITALGRFIVHLGSSSKVDPYVHVGFGYVNYTHTYSSTNSYSSYNNGSYSNGGSENFIPIGLRAGFGMRIFFNENLGANVDLGLGGALFTTGLTYKFFKKEE
ncbi:MAG: hypothetical protein H7329_19740 [Opitutaceae bacterium]|nr:hypothetical protein [Cytophagales bacterium]